jgi:hypothetical protein
MSNVCLNCGTKTEILLTVLLGYIYKQDLPQEKTNVEAVVKMYNLWRRSPLA